MTEEVEAPKWMKDLEAKRERRLKTKLGHESGAGAPCLSCLDGCPGLDLHFWRKVCKNCKCGKESHDIQDDDQFGYAQFHLLGSKPNKPSKIRLPGKKDELELEWMPKGQKDAVEHFLKTLPADLLPIKGSTAAQNRKERLLKQIPLHDIDPTFCHDLTEPELKQMNDYIKDVKDNIVGQGEIIRLTDSDVIADKMMNLRFAENNPELLGRKVLRPIVDVQNPTLPFFTNKYAPIHTSNGTVKAVPTFNSLGQLVNNNNTPIFDRVGKPITTQYGPLHFDENNQLVNADGNIILDHNHKPITKDTIFNCKEPPKVVNPVFELISRNYIPEMTEFNSKQPLFSQPLFNCYGELVNGDYQPVLDEYNAPITDQYGTVRFDNTGRLVSADGMPIISSFRREIFKEALYGNLIHEDVVLQKHKFSTNFYDKTGRPILGKLLPDPSNSYEPVFDKYGKAIHLRNGKPVNKVFQPLYDVTGRPIVDQNNQQLFKQNIPMFNKDQTPMTDEFDDILYRELVPILDSSNNVIFHDSRPVCQERIPLANIVKDNKPGVVAYQTKEPVLDANGQVVLDPSGKPTLKYIVPIVDDDNVPVLDSHHKPIYQYTEPVLDASYRPILDDSNQLVMRDFLPILDENGDQYLYDDGSPVYQQTEPIMDDRNRILTDRDGNQLVREYVPVVDQNGRIVIDKFNLPLYEISEPLLANNSQPVFGQYPTPILKESKPVLNQFGSPILDKYGIPVYEEQSIILDENGRMKTDHVGSPLQTKTRVSKPYRLIRPNNNIPSTGLYNQHGKLLNDISNNKYEPVYDRYGKPFVNPMGQIINKVKEPMLDSYGKTILDRSGNPLYKERIPMVDKNSVIMDGNGQPVCKEITPLVNSNNKPLYCEENNSVLVKERFPIFKATGEVVKDKNGRVVCQIKEPFIGSYNKPILDRNNELLLTNSIPILDDDDNVLLHNNGGIIYQFSEPYIGERGEIYYDNRGQPLKRDYLPILDGDDKPLLEDNGFAVYQQNEPLINPDNSPVLDSDGNPVYKQYIPVVNDAGKMVVDSFGLPLYQVIEPILNQYGEPINFGPEIGLMCKESTPVIDKNSCPILDTNGKLKYSERAPLVPPDQLMPALGLPQFADTRVSKAPEEIRPANHIVKSDGKRIKPEFYRQNGEKMFDDQGRHPNFIYEPFRDANGQIMRDKNGKVVNTIRQPLVDYFGDQISDNTGQKLYKDCIPIINEHGLVTNRNGSPVYKEVIPVLDKAGLPMYDQNSKLLYKENIPLFGKNGMVVLDSLDSPVYQMNEPMMNRNNQAISDSQGNPLYKYAIPVLNSLDEPTLDKQDEPIYKYSEPYLTESGDVIYDKAGNPIYRRYLPLVDEKGNIIFDENGKPIYQQNEPLWNAQTQQPMFDKYNNILYKEYVPLLGADGKVIVDDKGLPLHQQNEPILDSLGNLAYKESVPLLDHNGVPVRDENGGQVYAERIPAISSNGTFARDANGYPIYNKNRVGKGLSTLYPSNYFIAEDNQEGISTDVGAISDISYDGQQSSLGSCRRCKKSFDPNSLVVRAERSSHYYHADCFRCQGCNQNLADLMYFYNKDDGEIYCGRDFAKIRGIPRCHGCDELIFTKEYCLTHHKTYHIKHYCCYNCDLPLVGQKFVMEGEQPFCFACFESVKADTCANCHRVIRAEERGLTLNGFHFHVTDECFACSVCRKPLLGGKIKCDQGVLYCSIDCFERRP